MDVRSNTRSKAACRQGWAELPANILRAISELLPRTDLRTIYQVCPLWNQHFWSFAEHLNFYGTPCPQDVSLLRKRLPVLTSLSLRHTRSLFQLTLTQLTSITIRWGTCADFSSSSACLVDTSEAYIALFLATHLLRLVKALCPSICKVPCNLLPGMSGSSSS